jgi:outer membrane protein assembly factor BamE (lipoprotein component of BamABCDE complex)
MTMRSFLTVAALVASLGGCGGMTALDRVQGKRVDDTQLAQLVPGKTTFQEAKTILGLPTSTSTGADGIVATYVYSKGGLTALDVAIPVLGALRSRQAEGRVVTLQFNQAGVLKDAPRVNETRACGNAMSGMSPENCDNQMTSTH